MARRIMLSNVNRDDVLTKLRRGWTIAKERPDEAGISATQAKELPGSFDDAVDELRDEPGLEPHTAALVVAFAPVAAKVCEDLWDTFLFPWLVRHVGDGAVSEDTSGD